MEVSTSSRRLTSSIRATFRSTVVPVFSSEAHSSATPAFFEDFTSIAPESVVSPCTRRWLGPGAPMPTISESSAFPILEIISRVRFCWPFSMRLTALWLVPRVAASSACVRPDCWRASRTRAPIRGRTSVVSVMRRP